MSVIDFLPKQTFMLSSRYLHLHEALGLGPMWLNQNAEVISSPPAVAAVETGVAATRSAVAAQRPAAAAIPLAQVIRSLSPAAQQARLAAMTRTGEAKAAAYVRPVSGNTETTDSVDGQTIEPITAAQTAVAGRLPPLEVAVRPSEIMVVSMCPSAEDSMVNQLFSGKVGVLLDNMLTAIHIRPLQAHKTCWVKSAPIAGNYPSTDEMAENSAMLIAELRQSKARAVLFLGQIFEQSSQQVLMQAVCGNVPYVVVPHPARLLRQPQLKAQAWQVLKQLKRMLSI